MEQYDTLISAPELHQLLGKSDLVVLDCRATLGNPAAGPEAWLNGHIPTAQHANLETQLAAPAHSIAPHGGGRHPLPPRDRFARQCADWGISSTTQVVAYDDAGGAYAARLWWLLRWVGHARSAVLDGGIQAWEQTTNAPLSTDQEAPPAPGNFSASRALTRTVTIEEVAATIANAPNVALLDARAEARFAGRTEPIDPVAGHIPGAHCYAHTGNLAESGLFLRPDQLAERFAEVAPPAPPPVCYCGSGVTATHNVLAMRVAGLPEAALYVGSWSEWSADDKRPRVP